jgi:GPI ethanolamine phosphate transferase 1
VAVALTAVLYIQHCPLIYYAYAGFPVFFWEEVVASRETLREGLKVLMRRDGKQVSPFTIASQSLLYIGILESLVYSFSVLMLT